MFPKPISRSQAKAYKKRKLKRAEAKRNPPKLSTKTVVSDRKRLLESHPKFVGKK